MDTSDSLERSANEVKILTMHGRYDSNLTKERAVQMYLRDFKAVTQEKFFGLTFWPVIMSMENIKSLNSDNTIIINNIEIPYDMVLFAINCNYLMILKPQTFEILFDINISNIINWKLFEDIYAFSITINDINIMKHKYQKQRDLLFFTKHIHEILQAFQIIKKVLLHS